MKRKQTETLKCSVKANLCFVSITPKTRGLVLLVLRENQQVDSKDGYIAKGLRFWERHFKDISIEATTRAKAKLQHDGQFAGIRVLTTGQG